MDRAQLAWAAGFFDAEGSITFHLPRGRHQRRATMDVSQAGRDRSPHVLERFRSVVDGGSLFGPYRGYLFYWRTHDAAIITATAVLLWPWLGLAKREQILRVASQVTSLWSAELLAFMWESHLTRDRDELTTATEERAWAAGFFDGDGSVGAYRQRTKRSEYLVLAAAVTQAAESGTVENLARFQRVAGAGSVNGPYAPRGWSRLPQYRWQLKGHKVELVLTRLWPWLDDVKRQAAASAIERAHSSFAARHSVRGTSEPSSR
jgi:hypothetical protein